MNGWIIIAVLTAVALYAIFVFNWLVRLRNLAREGWSGIDVQLKRRTDLVPNLVATVQAYAAQIEAGNPIAALAQRTTVTPTEVMVTASGLLRAANLAVFELGMWQSWTGR